MSDSSRERNGEFPPDCGEHEQCYKCHKCYSEYVREKMAGELNEAD